MRILSVLASIVVAAAVSVTAQRNDQREIDKGREAVGHACVACHNNILRMVQIQKKTADQWKDTVYSMIGRGGHILPEEIDPLVAFLVANSGRNRPSSSAANQAAPQLPEAEGRAILVRSCQQCHDLDAALRKPESRDWSTVVAAMVTYGARVTPAEQQKLIEYLTGLK